MTTDIAIDAETDVIAEVDNTIPDAATLKAKVSIEGKTNKCFALAKDGSRFFESVYLADEGGYAYRRYDTTKENTANWSFARTKDFEENFKVFYSCEKEMKMLLNQLNTLTNTCQEQIEYIELMESSMGNKSKTRFGKKLVKVNFNKKNKV